jgi:hypothetical protein
MGSQPQYQQQLQQQQPQAAADNNSALPAYLQQNQNAGTANPTPNNLSSMAEMPGMASDSKVGGEQPQQQIALPQQANTDSFSFNKKDPSNPPSPAFGKKDKDKKEKTKFAGDDDDKRKAELAAKAKSPFIQAPSLG